MVVVEEEEEEEKPTTVKPLLSGHPGYGKCNRGSSEISIIFSRNVTSF